LPGGLVGVLAAVAGCALIGLGRDERFVEPDQPKTSPSGEFIAHVADGPDDNGVATRVVVITDVDGRKVFRDDYAYSTRHGVGVTWLSSTDQLWILSADVGNAYVERRPDGTWSKTPITPENRNTIPPEIVELV